MTTSISYISGAESGKAFQRALDEAKRLSVGAIITFPRCPGGWDEADDENDEEVEEFVAGGGI